MSTGNNEKIYQQNVLDIFKTLIGVKEDKKLAEIIGIIPEELANRKRRGTLVQTIFSEAIKRKMNLNEIFYPHEKIGIKRKFLQEIEEWLDELEKEEPGRDLWFEYQFKDNFSGFKEWKEGKEEERKLEPEALPYKIAGNN